MESSLGLGGTTASLQGNWKFIGMHSKTASIVELKDGTDLFKTITTSEYISTQNTGTIQIDASKIIATNVGYRVDTIATGLVYENNILIDSLSFPFTFVAPPRSSVTDYTRVSSDSIYFTGGHLINVAGSAPLNKPTGVKLSFQGDKLIMTMSITASSTQNLFGLQQISNEMVKAVLTYQRQ